MTLRISSLSALSAGEEIKVTFEMSNGEHKSRQGLVISSKQYLVLGLQKGDCTTELYGTVEHLATVWSAVKRGTSLLAYGSCSEKALRVKLVSKGIERDVADEAVHELVSMGVLRPFDDALREAQKMYGKLWGKKRIAAGLYEKGYSAEAVSYAIDELEATGTDYTANCRKLIEKRYGGVPEEVSERKKLYASLARYGYTVADIREAFTFFLQE